MPSMYLASAGKPVKYDQLYHDINIHVSWHQCSFRVPGAVVEAHARAVAASVVPRATKGIPGRMMDMLTQELMCVLEGSDGAAERCAAMESLFWLQVSTCPMAPVNECFSAMTVKEQLCARSAFRARGGTTL